MKRKIWQKKIAYGISIGVIKHAWHSVIARVAARINACCGIALATQRKTRARHLRHIAYAWRAKTTRSKANRRHGGSNEREIINQAKK